MRLPDATSANARDDQKTTMILKGWSEAYEN